jgi:phage nucleotide-binding protein
MKVRNARSSDATGATILLYGESGAGKTSCLGTLGGKTLVIDIEGGTVVLRDKDVDIATIPEDLTGLRELFDELTASKPAYDNICLDSATELEKFMLVCLGRKSSTGTPTLNDYGVATFKMRDYIRRLRDLREHGINIVVTALEMPVELEASEGTTRTRLYPMMSKKLTPEVCGMFDIVGHVEVSRKEGHEGERFIRLDGTDQVVAKNRWGKGTWAAPDLAKLIASTKCADPDTNTSDGTTQKKKNAKQPTV